MSIEAEETLNSAINIVEDIQIYALQAILGNNTNCNAIHQLCDILLDNVFPQLQKNLS